MGCLEDINMSTIWYLNQKIEFGIQQWHRKGLKPKDQSESKCYRVSTMLSGPVHTNDHGFGSNGHICLCSCALYKQMTLVLGSVPRDVHNLWFLFLKMFMIFGFVPKDVHALWSFTFRCSCCLVRCRSKLKLWRQYSFQNQIPGINPLSKLWPISSSKKTLKLKKWKPISLLL